MSKYTTELRFICEEFAGLDESRGYNSVDEVINASYLKIFDFDFPIFNEEYRSILEKKILIHFYTREICEETVGLWKLRLRDRLNMVMPYYNKLYESELIEFDPMVNIDEHIDDDYNKWKTDDVTRTDDLTERTDGTTTRNGQEQTTSNRKNTNTDNHNDWELYSDTPQGSIDRIDLEQNAYLTNATHSYGTGGTIVDQENSGSNKQEHSGTTVGQSVKNTGTQTRNGVAHTNNEGDKNIKGMDMTKLGNTPSKMLKEYRELFLNIDLMVMNELEELFIQLW